jgi:hypothetical protein
MTNLLLMAFDLTEPMPWERLIAMPSEYQAAYITGIIGQFGATDEMLADLFGVHKNTVAQRRKKLGVKPGCDGGIRARTGWMAWCRGRANRVAELTKELETTHPEVTVL